MRRITVIIFSLFVIQSCNQNTVSQQDIDALIKKTLDNMVFVEGGSFMMGDAGGEFTDKNGKKHVREYWTGSTDNKPAHKVTLDSYHIGKFEVTYAEHDIYSAVNKKEIIYKKYKGKEIREQHLPVYLVNWFVANDYCAWLAKESGMPFDLLTEAQWEYAARSRGKNVLYATDNGKLEFGRNLSGSDQASYSDTYDKLFPPNPLGVYAMTASSAEWVKDWYDADYYKSSPELNPTGASNGDEKILRGGGILGVKSVSVFTRLEEAPNHKEHGGAAGGIRCVLNVSKSL